VVKKEHEISGRKQNIRLVHSCQSITLVINFIMQSQVAEQFQALKENSVNTNGISSIPDFKEFVFISCNNSETIYRCRFNLLIISIFGIK
jgi:hypothetical protein